MSYPQHGARSGAIPKERQKDGCLNKGLDVTMESDFKRDHLKGPQPLAASHISMNDQSEQSENSSVCPSDDGDQIRDKGVHQERPVSPTFSYQSIKSDESMTTPLFFKEGDLTQIKDLPLSITTPEESGETCNFCDLKAVKTCLTCTASFCETHVKKHYTEAKLLKHTLVEVTGDLDERLCQEHHRLREVFCRTDQRLICFECTFNNHKEHDLADIKQAGRQTQDEEQHQRPALVEVLPNLSVLLPPPGEIQFQSVTSDSVSLRWGSPEGLPGPHKYRVTWGCDGEESSQKVKDLHHLEINGLQPGKMYQFRVATEGENDSYSGWVSESVATVVPAPRDLKINPLEATSFTLSWTKALGLDQIPQRFLVSYRSPETEPQAANTKECTKTLSGLQLGTEYTVSVSTVLTSGESSEPVRTTICTVLPPDKLNVDSVNTTSATLSWHQPSGMDQAQLHYLISYDCRGKEICIKTDSSTITFPDLQPATEYSVTVSTVLENGNKSQPVSTTFTTNIPPPGYITVHSTTESSISLSWRPPDGMDEQPYKFKVMWLSGVDSDHFRVQDSGPVNITNLMPGTEYKIRVATNLDNGQLSPFVSTQTFTEPSSPRNLWVEEVKRKSITLCWDIPADMEEVSYSFITTYSCNGDEKEKETKNNRIVLSDLEPDTKYTFSVSTVTKHGSRSTRKTLDEWTRSSLQGLIDKLGLKKKLTTEIVREIGEDSDKPVTSLVLQQQCFLRRLLMMNMKARSLKCDTDRGSSIPEVNPLDLITALFICSDGFLQQEMALKMSMCQFAVPLLLPNCDTEQSTLMLWAMRDIVKPFRSCSSDDQSEFVEKSIVQTHLPMVSFVRLGNSTLSKSQLLNEVISNSQQNYNTFVHNDMTAGNIRRMISDGLVEISWYLPCGKKNIDVFTEPLAVANLRGDVCSFQTQFSFLCQTSAAVFVFCDDLGSGCSILNLQNMKARLFIVCTAEAQIDDIGFEKHSIIRKDKQTNDAQLVKKLRSAVTEVMKENPHKFEVQEMPGVAHNLNILVDEDGVCLSAKERADSITKNIDCIPSYKEIQLPLQGDVWKRLTTLEKEECKLNRVGEMNRSELKQKKEEIRKEQLSYGMNVGISDFIDGLKSSREELPYFLKWMKLNLDTLSRKLLFDLRMNYKDMCQHSPENKEVIANLDKKISDSSLGTEHFLREVGQLYESSMSSDETSAIQHQVQGLPRICAQLILDGFPLELIDGDASNIPIKWITDVFKELNNLTKSDCKIRVVTVLGVQSSGKSTLLNTMFGVQFAVSSGRCTRGAFMQLIKVKDELKNELQCDFIMVIDTEGLKSLQSTQLTDNYQHDNELATLLVGLSDISIVNIAMDNITDMKDTLQIVAHAFLRMKESGKKPSCQLVHQNVADISAHGKNLRDRNRLLNQLNEMTIVASRMENTGDDIKFTDIIECNLEDTCYIPGLWHGSPPMAPVNEGYSEEVANLKRKLINAFKKEKGSGQTIPKFVDELRGLWMSVKYENFIFSFRNSIVAEAYNNLCVEFNRWDRSFQKHIYKWLTEAETRVANYGMMGYSEESGLDEVLSGLKIEASNELQREGKLFLDSVSTYYKSEEGNVYMVEKYREEFKKGAESRCKETESVVRKKLEVAVDLRKCTFRVDEIQKSNRDTLDKQVSDLVKKFSGGENPMNDQQLENAFEEMWKQTTGKLSFNGLEHQNVAKDIYKNLKINLERESSKVQEMLDQASPLENCGLQEFQVKSEHKAFGILAKIKKTKDSQKISKDKTQAMSIDIINRSKRFVSNKVKERTDYHHTYMTELLELIEENLSRDNDLHFSPEFAASLKIHICGHAAREFQQMHEAFNRDKDPRQSLDKLKPQFLADFKDLFNKRDQCKRKAEEFTNLCLKPAIRYFITKSLSPDIYDEMLSNSDVDFRTRRSFQFSILKNLLSEDFRTFFKYTDYYESFAFEFIIKNIVGHLSNGSNIITKMEVKHLNSISGKIKEAVEESLKTSIEKADGNGDLNFNKFLQDLLFKLSTLLIIPTDTTGMTLDNSKTKDFSVMLISSVEEMKNRLSDEFHKDQDVQNKLASIPDSPQDLLYNKMFGCGKQCPFCKTPCDAQGNGHSMHSAYIHRPDGLGGYRWKKSDKLSIDKCSSLVDSKKKFCNAETKGKFSSYKDYPLYFKDWRIDPDNSHVTDYWKFLFVKHNKEYAENHSSTLPADIPEDWRSITSEQALKSLTETFYPKP
ncbi:interferon-induced very large GTPase 1-like isoform X2 [Oncorhynchus nerka]|uniref:interferon-induced very large GTPase 1-like isoform X2 n=1 Tax=Oncorhynchus nerka TaxID=8023 RepID=UPI0031B8864D